jgi:hypothetical protein
MTKSVNKFAAAIANVLADRSMNSANIKKMQSRLIVVSRKDVAQMLTDAKVDAARFDKRAMYATVKCVDFVAALTQDVCSIDDFEKNSFVTFKTALLCADANEHLRFSDIESAILANVKIDETRAHLIYQRRDKISADAQTQQVRDMLKTLNVVREVAKNTFAIDAESVILNAARAKISDLA